MISPMGATDVIRTTLGMAPARPNKSQLALEQAKQFRDEGYELARESVSMMMQLSLALEDRGWLPADGLRREPGSGNLSLEAVKKAAENGRALGTGNPIVVSAIDKKIAVMLQRPFQISGADDVVKKNKQRFFTTTAMSEHIRGKATAGNLFWVLNPGTKGMSSVPFSQITSAVYDQNDQSVIKWFLREWDEVYTDLNHVTHTTHRKLLYANKDLEEYGYELPSVLYGIAVYPFGRMFHIAPNKLPNQPWGLPDMLAGIFYTAEHKELIEAGDSIYRAQSQVAVQYRSKTRKAFEAVAASIASPLPADPLTGEPLEYGATQNLGPDVEMQLMSKIGAGIDFATFDPIAALATSVLGIPVDIVLAKEKAGDAMPVVMVAKMTVEQQFWSEVFEEVFEYFSKQKAKIYFPKINPDPTHRQIQSIVGAAKTGVISPQQTYELVRDTFGANWEDSVPHPELWKPFVEALKPATTAPGSTEPGAQPVTPGQGQTGQVGKLADGDHSLRDEGQQDHARK